MKLIYPRTIFNDSECVDSRQSCTLMFVVCMAVYEYVCAKNNGLSAKWDLSKVLILHARNQIKATEIVRVRSLWAVNFSSLPLFRSKKKKKVNMGKDQNKRASTQRHDPLYVEMTGANDSRGKGKAPRQKFVDRNNREESFEVISKEGRQPKYGR